MHSNALLPSFETFTRLPMLPFFFALIPRASSYRQVFFDRDRILLDLNFPSHCHNHYTCKTFPNKACIPFSPFKPSGSCISDTQILNAISQPLPFSYFRQPQVAFFLFPLFRIRQPSIFLLISFFPPTPPAISVPRRLSIVFWVILLSSLFFLLLPSICVKFRLVVIHLSPH